MARISPLYWLPASDVLRPNLEGAAPEIIQRVRPWLRGLAAYHRHEVTGLHHVPPAGRALLVVNHSLATYDGLLLAMSILDATGRLPMGLGDDLIFRTPGLRHLARGAGIVPANPRNAHALLERGHLVGVAPGGMREALRPTAERYTVHWRRRKGFVRLALRTGTPLILAGCPAADDLYRIYETRITKLAYKHLKVPLPLVRGFGPTLLPRPVKLVHRVMPPILPPPVDEANFEAQVDALHAEVVRTMEALLATEAPPA